MQRTLLKIRPKPHDLSIWPNNEVADGVKSVGARRKIEDFKLHEALIFVQRNQSLQSRPMRFAGLFLGLSLSSIDLRYLCPAAQSDRVWTFIVYFVREQAADILIAALTGQVDILFCRAARGRELSYGAGRGAPLFRWHKVLSGGGIRSNQTKRYTKRQSAEVTGQFQYALDSLG